MRVGSESRSHLAVELELPPGQASLGAAEEVWMADGGRGVMKTESEMPVMAVLCRLSLWGSVRLWVWEFH